MGGTTTCEGCGLQFPSRNAVFRHLKDTNGACLSETAHRDWIQFVQQQQRDKVILLFGYLTNNSNSNTDGHGGDGEKNGSPGRKRKKKILNGTHAAQLLQTILNADDSRTKQTADDDEYLKINRSYGNMSRPTEIVRQDEGTSAISEVFMTRLPPLTVSVDAWLDQINAEVDRVIQRDYHVTGEDHNCRRPQVRLLGRQNMPSAFNAEMDVTHRRVEYLLPADFLYVGNSSVTNQWSRTAFFQTFFSTFPDGVNSTQAFERPPDHVLNYLHGLKKKMQSLTTQIVALDTNDAAAVLEKEIHNHKRQRAKKASNQKNDNMKNKNKTLKQSTSSGSNCDKKSKKATSKNTSKKKKVSQKGQNVLKRRRFHNFTPMVMAHEFLAYRRMDRLYHRATCRFALNDGAEVSKRPFLALSLTGDIFLNGQTCRVVGLLIALARELIELDIVDCLFDEDYGHLVPTPPAPLIGMYAAEASYINWEGKAKAILSPRPCDRFANGWGGESTLGRVNSWKEQVRENIAHTWLSRGGVDAENRLVVEREWTQNVLEPWAKRAREQLGEYRQWKASHGSANRSKRKNEVTGSTPTRSLGPPSLESISTSVPPMFEKVLQYLREADARGLWPSTTHKRQLVMISTVADQADSPESDPKAVSTSLSDAQRKAQSNNESRSSAYVFAEGEGGASGSFSVGAMPGDRCTQPKANSIFPELMKAAFELEIALCPDREPSSTIAVNRNARFRPHTDSGAGAGQSTSLIVGLGTYAGGELVVEGERKDIRYKAVEFNGWKQRHWTMPFQGERYSLVWFTPKGCEGVRGINLCVE